MDKNRKTNFFVIILMNLIVYPMIFVWTGIIILVSPFLMLVIIISPFWRLDRFIRLFVWIYGRGWMAILSPFVRFKREGFTKTYPRPPCIMVINHQSFFDTYCMALFPFSDVTFAIRSWPFKLFWYAPFMRMARYLDVETLGWQATSEIGGKMLARQSSLLFFPEGHRSRDGNLGRFYSGAFKVAVDTGAKVVPVCISGTGDLLPPGRWWLAPTVIKLKALPPIDPNNFSGPMAHSQMRKHVKKKIAECLEEFQNC